MASKQRDDQGSRRSYFMMDPNDLVVIGLDTEDDQKHHLYDNRIKLPMDEGLVKNIQVYGVLEPVLAQRDGDRVLVVDGRRRVIHAREAFKRQKAAGEETVLVPVIMKRAEEDVIFGISRAANACRVDDGPITNARNAQRMLDMGSDEDTVAATFGVKKATLKTWLALLDLSPKVRNAVEKGEVSAQAAFSLTNLSKEDQDKHLEELRASGVKPTKQAVENKVRAQQGKTASKTPKQRIEEAMEVLRKVFDKYADGTPVDAKQLNAIAKALSGKTLDQLKKEELAAEAKEAEAPVASDAN